MSEQVWVFGYGSLVAPASLARTIGRHVEPGRDRLVAHLHGYGRRWNYGSLHLRGDWAHEGRRVRGGLVVSLGITAADDESCNGVVVAVSDDELAELDWRERDYQRTDVTLQTEVLGDHRGRVVTYVPRASAIERYQRARDEGRAAVRRTYWDLVHTAFRELGGEHAAHFRRTPLPEVPVADITVADITSAAVTSARVAPTEATPPAPTTARRPAR